MSKNDLKSILRVKHSPEDFANIQFDEGIYVFRGSMYEGVGELHGEVYGVPYHMASWNARYDRDWIFDFVGVDGTVKRIAERVDYGDPIVYGADGIDPSESKHGTSKQFFEEFALKYADIHEYDKHPDIADYNEDMCELYSDESMVERAKELYEIASNGEYVGVHKHIGQRHRRYEDPVDIFAITPQASDRDHSEMTGHEFWFTTNGDVISTPDRNDSVQVDSVVIDYSYIYPGLGFDGKDVFKHDSVFSYMAEKSGMDVHIPTISELYPGSFTITKKLNHDPVSLTVEDLADLDGPNAQL